MTNPTPKPAHELRGFASRRLPYVAAFAVLAAVIVLVAWRALTHEPEPEVASPVVEGGAVTLGDAARRQAGISVERVRILTRDDRVHAPAVLAVDERRTVRLGSMVEGIVVLARAEVGDRVGSGKVLAELHSKIVHDLWADYRKAVADRRRRETELAFAQQSVARARRLLADKAVSQQEVQRAEADLVANEEYLDMARTDVRRSEEALEHYGITNAEDPSGESGETIPVRSPLSGVVLEKHLTQGTAVTPGQLLYVVSDLSTLWAIAEIDETLAPLVHTGNPVDLRVSAYPGERFAGTVAFVADAVNPKTRRVTVRCDLPNGDRRLKPDMYASVDLGTGAPRQVVAVPAAAIQEIDGRPLVFVRSATGAFERRDVTVGTETEGWIEVRSGLAPEETVAAAGSFLLKSELLRGTLAEEE